MPQAAAVVASTQQEIKRLDEQLDSVPEAEVAALQSKRTEIQKQHADAIAQEEELSRSLQVARATADKELKEAIEARAAADKEAHEAEDAKAVAATELAEAEEAKQAALVERREAEEAKGEARQAGRFAYVSAAVLA